MDYKQTKIGKFFLGKGFYGVLALCLVAVGAAAWSALEPAKDSDLVPQNIGSQNTTSSNPPLSDSEVKAETEDEIPYSSEDASSIAPDTAPPVATSFTSPMSGGVIKSHSETELVYSATFSDMRTHLGIDIEGESGADIRSCGNGVVLAVKNDSLLGKYVLIDHGRGVTAKYCGLDTIYVTEGETVSATTCIGLLGEIPSEIEDICHLHLEFYFEENSVDPLEYIGQ